MILLLNGHWYVVSPGGVGETGTSIADGARHHLAVTTDSAADIAYMHVDGTYVQYIPYSGAMPAATTLLIAAAGGAAGDKTGWGAIDEVRVSTGKRYGPAAFTAPTGPFAKDASTVFLAHLDGSGAVAAGAADSTLAGLPSTIVAGQPLSAATYTTSTAPAYFVLYRAADAVEEGLRWASGAMPGALTLLIPQTAGAYIVRGYDAATGGNKVYGSAQFTVTAAPGALPAIPTQTADTGATSSGVTMNWTATGTSYRVLARAGVGSAYGSLADATVSTNSYTFTGLAANSSARAVIIPRNANGYGTPTGQFISFTTA